MAGQGWPVVHRYEGEDRTRISLPLGGIGTGTVGFGGRGQFRDWELENRPAQGSLSELTFLGCRVVPAGGGEPDARVLEGALFDGEAQGEVGSPSPLAGLPRFRQCVFEAAYPFGRVLLSDPDFPLRAVVEVFNPLVPADEASSSLPVASIAVTLESLADEPLDCSVMLSVEALPGHLLRSEGLASLPCASKRSADGLEGYLLSDEALDGAAEEWGTLAAAAKGPNSWTGPVWGLGKWNQGLFDMWQGFYKTGLPGAGTFGVGEDGPAPTFGSSVAGTVGVRHTISPGEVAHASFLLSWHFPNRRSWTWGRWGPEGASGPDTIGNFYATEFDDAWDVLAKLAPRMGQLRGSTEDFVETLWSSDVPAVVKEAALFNLSTLRSQTVFRSADGTTAGWEGCLDNAGSCLGSCTHVWNYDLATGHLFGDMAKRMRELEYLHATSADGAMSFRILLPPRRGEEWGHTAADGQFGCVLKLYREWRLSGDLAWLRRLWPACRRSIEFAWVEGGWDADSDGLAEGAQHNTTDVEYYGPNPVVQSWYLAALSAGAEMAGAVGDDVFAKTCQTVLASGAALTEQELFNGSYYEQRVIPPGDFSTVAPKLRHPTMGAADPGNPEFQIGDGCIADQLVGDTYARLLGLPGVLDDSHVRAALSSIHRHNYVADFGNWANYMRTYALDGERGHIVESYPKGLPERPMPYWCEVWTGLEYVYAIGLAQAGEEALAEDVVMAGRERFSGRRRNPFDETECGHHYARALSSWGLLAAFTGFVYDGRDGVMRFRSAGQDRKRWFWSTGAAWGAVYAGGAAGEGARLDVHGGSVHVEEVVVGGEHYAPAKPGPLTVGSYELEGAAMSPRAN